ncbi:hypothetical protein LZ554_001906 [Drepanopeziza brunnea f. sp. 'monogermtubi']|nr:hypothetical protein LZ554_001906 [Drepanopeziza brunnea f. sp. 'monogermtubi']
MPGSKSNLDVVKDCDNFPYYEIGNPESYESQMRCLWKFFLPNDPRPHGFILDEVVEKMPWTTDYQMMPDRKEIHLKSRNDENREESCSQSIEKLLDIARDVGVFPKLGKKRNEQYSIVGARFPIGIERSASSLFGIIGQGVHMTLYTRTRSGMKFWISERNHNKSTYPGMLDNAVAGGVAHGETPFECLVREASEEAAILDQNVRERAKAAGTVTWFNISGSRAGGEPGLMNPGLLYVYDLEVAEDVTFEPVDNDVHAFHLMDVQQVKDAMLDGKFKPSSASVMMDFLIRHGFITIESEKDYVEIVSRLHRRLSFPTSAR